MTEEPEQPRLSDEVDASVRALLGEARVGDPMPAEVADRIDRALADARPPRADATVVRFRRRLAGGLVAAAVVVVGGGLLAAQLHDTSGSDDSTAAGGSAASADGRSEKSAPNVLPGLTPAPLSTGRAQLPRIRSAHFAADVARLATAGYAAQAPSASPGKSPATDSLRSPTSADCATPPSVPQGADVREVTLDGRLAMLVVDAPDASPREATAYSCDGSRTLAAAALPD